VSQGDMYKYGVPLQNGVDLCKSSATACEVRVRERWMTCLQCCFTAWTALSRLGALPYYTMIPQPRTVSIVKQLR
jgi:hypothetical protein